jgi:tetratricopeptide (TPR) repeat protein
MKPGLSALVLAAAALCLGPPLVPVASAQKVDALPDDYREIVGQYAAGETAAALFQLGGWSDERVRKHVSNLSDAVVSIRKCPGCPIRVAFTKFPLRAALLLHLDRELQEHFSLPESEQAPVCGSGLQAIAFEHLASILTLVDPAGGAFVKRAYLGMSGQAMWFHCFPEAVTWARSGVKRFPKEASLLLAEGVALEARAYFNMTPAPVSIGLSPATMRMRDELNANLRFLRDQARQSFEAAVAADPALTEARLRLGRVLWRQGRLEPARAALQAALGQPAEAPQQYLAHLFLGRVLEDSGDAVAAEEHYRIALALRPLSEIAAMAISHARFLQGDSEGARQALRSGLLAARRRLENDPWVPYMLPQSPEGEAILAELRQAAGK